MELLQAADVVEGDGNWTSGGMYDAAGCAMRSYVSPVCAPEREPLSNEDEGVGEPTMECGVDSFPFAVVIEIPSRVRGNLAVDFESWVRGAMPAETEKAVGEYLFGGSDAYDVAKRYAWLGSDEVRTVAPGANAQATLSDLLQDFWANTVGTSGADALLHLGIEVVWQLSNTLIEDGRLLGTNIRVVSSPGYPVDAIAITGPIRIHLGSIQELEAIDTSRNDRVTEATRLVSMEFDPCRAVRVE